MSQAALFPETPPPFGAIQDDLGAWRWRCPHCGGWVAGEDDETAESLAADPACCLCRAEFRDMPFREWRKLPQSEKDASRPPSEWRSSIDRSEPGPAYAARESTWRQYP